MSNEQEKIAIEQEIRDGFTTWLNATGCIPDGTSYWYECMGCIKDSATKLVNAGIGDKKQAVREFARKICDKAFFLRKTEIADQNGEFVTVDEYVDNLCYNIFEELFGEKLCLYGADNE